MDFFEIEKLIKKIKALRTSIANALPTPSKPKVSGKIEKPKAPGTMAQVKGPKNKKDGVKVAEQLGDKNAKKAAKKNKEALTVDKNGQWSLK